LFDLKEYEGKMARTLEVLGASMGKIRSGRAHAGMLDHVKAKCYGTELPISQTSAVSVQDSRSLVVAPWDKQNVQAIEKAILEADLGVGAAVEGDKIRVTVPQLSEERRCELVKVIKKEAEAAKVAVRNIRRDGNSEIKGLVKEGDLGEDEARRHEAELQKATDQSIEKAEAMSHEKEADLMKV